MTSKDFAVRRLTWALLAAISGVSVGMSACWGGSEGTSGETGEGAKQCVPIGSYGLLEECEGQFVHRPTAANCPVPARVGPGEIDWSGTLFEAEEDHECESDLDCDERPNGFCTVHGGNGYPRFRACTYACTTDTQCGEDAICACAEEYPRGSEMIPLGTCVPATCRTDADCGLALCISPLGSSCTYPDLAPFHCQSSSDTCAGKDDCSLGEGCQHDGTFTCKGAFPCGRPFLVLGAARVATEAAAGDWADSSLRTSESELTAELRAEVERHYIDAGLMEHASIAAFARFSLQLLALGAPAELITETTTAMQDETRHARLCFGLAARYGTRNIGPGPLEITGALGAVDLLTVADLVITEGCIGETSAALEAAWAAEAAEDTELRALLSGIASDELRHAALAFRFIAWAAARDPRVRPLLAQRVQEARRAAAQRTAAPTDTDHARARAAGLARHGVLDAHTRTEARRRALEEIVMRAIAQSNPAAIRRSELHIS